MNKKDLQNRSCVVAVAIGAVLALFATLLLAVIIAICMNGEYIGINYIGASSHIAHVFGAFIGCLVAAMLCPGKRSVTTFITAAVYFGILILSAYIFCDRLSGGVAAGACLIVLSAFMVLYLARRKKKTRIPHRSNRRNG